MCMRILIFAHDWGGSLVVFISLTAFLMFHGYAYRLNRVNFALAKRKFLCLTPSSDSSSILQVASYPPIECWLSSPLDTKSGPFLDCGASYPLVQLWEDFIIHDGVQLRPLYSDHACIIIIFCSHDSLRLP